jgi:hypothetical protein
MQYRIYDPSNAHHSTTAGDVLKQGKTTFKSPFLFRSWKMAAGNKNRRLRGDTSVAPGTIVNHDSMPRTSRME